jgi:hypothetical protein
MVRRGNSMGRDPGTTRMDPSPWSLAVDAHGASWSGPLGRRIQGCQAARVISLPAAVRESSALELQAVDPVSVACAGEGNDLTSMQKEVGFFVDNQDPIQELKGSTPLKDPDLFAAFLQALAATPDRRRQNPPPHPESHEAWIDGPSGELVRDGPQTVLLGLHRRLGHRHVAQSCIADVTRANGTRDLIDSARVKHVSDGSSRINFKTYDQGR